MNYNTNNSINLDKCHQNINPIIIKIKKIPSK